MGSNSCRTDLGNLILKSVHRGAEHYVGGGVQLDLLFGYCANVVIHIIIFLMFNLFTGFRDGEALREWAKVSISYNMHNINLFFTL